MDWVRILFYITGTVDQELLLRNEYLVAENRILKAQQTRADVFIPAVFGGTGTVEIVLVDRVGSEVRLNVPNRPSTVDRVSVMFRDDMR